MQVGDRVEARIESIDEGNHRVGGGGHPVGATGVRMLLDSYLQVTGQATGYQVEGARRFATLNFGGSRATVVCTVVEAE